MLDEQSAVRWHKPPVKSGQMLELEWSYHASHLTRRWNDFVTQACWDPNRPLARDQFESEPFYKAELTAQPFWEHQVRLSERRGYHVVLAAWEVADTGNAFYQVIDFNFS